MANYPIPVIGKKIDFKTMFGEVTLDVLASEVIFINNIDGANVRTNPTVFNIGAITQIDGNNYIITDSGSSTITSSELRDSERLIVVDASGNVVGAFQFVASSGVDLVAMLLVKSSDFSNFDRIEVPTDDYIDDKRPVTFNTNDIPFLNMASSSGGYIDVSVTTHLKKKASIASSGGSGGGDTYTNANPTPETIGGISAGSTFLNQTMQQMWDALLYPYQAPAFLDFKLDRPTTVEVGTNLSGSANATWATSNSGNVQANSIKVDDLTGGTNLFNNSANDGSEPTNITAQHNNQANHTWRITGTNTKGGNFTRDFTIHWYFRVFYGNENTTPLTESDIEGLSDNLLTNTFNRTYHFASGGGYKYVCYPTSFGTATNFTDVDTGFAVAMEAPYVVSVTNSLGITHDINVHRTTNEINGALNMSVS